MLGREQWVQISTESTAALELSCMYSALSAYTKQGRRLQHTLHGRDGYHVQSTSFASESNRHKAVYSFHLGYKVKGLLKTK